jgi:predicted membrane protein
MGIEKQSRRMSLVEAITNVVVGFGVALLTQIIVFPLFDLIFPRKSGHRVTRPEALPVRG